MNLLKGFCKKVSLTLVKLFYSDEAVGGVRTQKKLLILEKTINGETRCCRVATWRERCVRAVVTPLGLAFAWEPFEWVD